MKVKCAFCKQETEEEAAGGVNPNQDDQANEGGEVQDEETRAMLAKILDFLRLTNRISAEDVANQYLCDPCLDKTSKILEDEQSTVDREIQIVKDRQKTLDVDFATVSVKLGYKREETDEVLRARLAELEAQEEAQKQRMVELVEKQLALEKEEAKFWEDLNRFEKKLMDNEEKNATAEKRGQYLERELERLVKFNVLSEVFVITTDEENGLINGLRIGVLKDLQNIFWDETNAAFGQIVFLFAYAYARFEVPSQGERTFDVKGSQSRVNNFPVYYDPQTKEVDTGMFNKGLRELLRCMVELHEHVRRLHEKGTSENLFYPVELPAKIAGQLIEFNQSRAQDWTLAMKSFLVNVKQLLTLFGEVDRQQLKRHSESPPVC